MNEQLTQQENESPNEIRVVILAHMECGHQQINDDLLISKDIMYRVYPTAGDRTTCWTCGNGQKVMSVLRVERTSSARLNDIVRYIYGTQHEGAADEVAERKS